MRTTITILSLAAVGFGSASEAMAVPLPPDLQGLNVRVEWGTSSVWNSANQPLSITSVVPGQKSGTYTVLGGWTSPGNWTATWELDVDTDPFVASSFNITNPSGVTQAYSVTVTLPVVPVGGPSVMEGSVSGSILDFNGSGSATVGTVAGSSLYEAYVDGGSVHTEYDFPYSLSTFTTDNLPTVNWGPLPGPAVIATIGIDNDFTLTAGDTFQMVSQFRINAIPAPGALAVMGLAGIAATRRRR